MFLSQTIPLRASLIIELSNSDASAEAALKIEISKTEMAIYAIFVFLKCLYLMGCERISDWIPLTCA